MENPGKGDYPRGAAVEPVATIAPSCFGVEAITSWCLVWNRHVPKQSIWETVGMGVPLHDQEAPCRSMGPGCYLEGLLQRQSHLAGTVLFDSMFRCFVAFLLLLLGLGRSWWPGMGHPPAELSPTQTPCGAQQEPCSRAGGQPACGGLAMVLGEASVSHAWASASPALGMAVEASWG